MAAPCLTLNFNDSHAEFSARLLRSFNIFRAGPASLLGVLGAWVASTEQGPESALATRYPGFGTISPDPYSSPANPNARRESRTAAVPPAGTSPDRDTFAFAAPPHRTVHSPRLRS